MRLIVVALLVLAAGCRPPGYGQGDDEPGADAARDAAGPRDGAPDGAGPDAGPTPDAAGCAVGFALAGYPAATSVWLTGDFVAWAGSIPDGAIALARGGDLVWRVTRVLPAGASQYKFIVDGASWIADPANAETVPDGFGGVNSVAHCP